MGDFQLRNTAIPRATRVVVLIQLCLVFWLMISSALKPFMTEFWAYKTTENLFLLIKGDPDLLSPAQRDDPEWQPRLESHRVLFTHLPQVEQESLEAYFLKERSRPGRSLSEAMHLVLQAWIQGLSSYSQAWLFFSFTICLLLLLRVEGGQQASWLLILLTALYALNNSTHGTSPIEAPDYRLIPSEKEITENYLKQPLKGNWNEQRQQLQKGWHIYLIENWAGESAAEEGSEQFAQQLEKGEFAFLVARLKAWQKYKVPSLSYQLREKRSFFFLFCALLWHVFFAYYVNRRKALEIETY